MSFSVPYRDSRVGNLFHTRHTNLELRALCGLVQSEPGHGSVFSCSLDSGRTWFDEGA
jgi:hypothetical protein